jgi:hypothetical protein
MSTEHHDEDDFNARVDERARELAEIGIEAVLEHEKLWIQFRKDNPTLQSYADLQLEKLSKQHNHVQHVAREAWEFIQKVRWSQYGEEMEELDLDLFRRERNFAKLLANAIIENRLLARLEEAQGPVGDLEMTLSRDKAIRSSITVDQLTGKEGYLTRPPTPIKKQTVSSRIGKLAARIILDSFRENRKQIRTQLVRFYSRYVVDLVRRNYFNVLLTVGVGELGLELIIHEGHFSPVGLGGLLIITSAIVVRLYEWLSKRHWHEVHRLFVVKAATNLYVSLMEFTPQRAFLDAMYDLSDPTKRKILFPPRVPGHEDSAVQGAISSTSAKIPSATN